MRITSSAEIVTPQSLDAPITIPVAASVQMAWFREPSSSEDKNISQSL
jgi:hypothetical protein